MSLNWVKINSHNDIPGRDENGRIRYFLAIHRAANYTSDVYMVWRRECPVVDCGGYYEGFNQDDLLIARWPHGAKNITHIAEYNLPEID